MINVIIIIIKREKVLFDNFLHKIKALTMMLGGGGGNVEFLFRENL